MYFIKFDSADCKLAFFLYLINFLFLIFFFIIENCVLNCSRFTSMPSKIPASIQEEQYNYNESENQNSTFSPNSSPSSTISISKQMEPSMAQEIVKEQEESKTKQTNSEEVFQDVLRKINSLGDRGKQILHKLMDTIDMQAGAKGAALKQLVNDTMNDKKLSREAKRRRRRDLVLSSPLYQELTEEDEDGDAAIEEVKISFGISCVLLM